jgi:type IV secretion system protein VirD4
MTPTKLLIGQIFVVFGIVILGVWAATQWAASMLGYQAQLGAPWAFAFGVPIVSGKNPPHFQMLRG